MSRPIYLIDAFADRPFEGNPAGAVTLHAGEWPARNWMQGVAAEMNQAETAFVRANAAGGPHGLRWFTPTLEVDLCGHATLAAAHALWTEHGFEGELTFETRSGPLTCRRGDDGSIVMDFPATPPEPREPEAALLAAAGVSPSDVSYAGRTRFDAFLALRDESAVRAATPDMRALGAATERGLIVTAAGGATAESGGFDFVSRFFAPAAGVDEDPVTGSAHCALAPYWSGVLGREGLVGRQLSRRGGTVRTRVAGDRVELAGRAVTVLRGQLAASGSSG